LSGLPDKRSVAVQAWQQVWFLMCWMPSVKSIGT
jgi:hypothetical protein